MAPSAKQELREDFHKHLDGDAGNALRIGHGHQPLNTFDPEWWVLAFTDLFFAGDFLVRRGLPLRKWAKTLLQRVDFVGWAACKEFAAAAYNIAFAEPRCGRSRRIRKGVQSSAAKSMISRR